MCYNPDLSPPHWYFKHILSLLNTCTVLIGNHVFRINAYFKQCGCERKQKKCEKMWKPRRPCPTLAHASMLAENDDMPFVMCTHTLIRINGRLEVLLKACWGGTVIRCGVSSSDELHMQWIHMVDLLFVITAFPSHSCAPLELCEHRVKNNCGWRTNYIRNRSLWILKSVWSLRRSISRKGCRD